MSHADEIRNSIHLTCIETRIDEVLGLQQLILSCGGRMKEIEKAVEQRLECLRRKLDDLS